MTEKHLKDILYEKDNDTGIVVLTINRPEIKNALTIRVLVELNWAADRFAEDDTAKALIFTGARPERDDDPTQEAFCSGAYLNPADLESMDEEMKREIDLTDIAQKKLCLKLWSIYKPVIVAMNGLAIGGGLTIPMACADLIFASEYAWGRLPFVNIGLVPEPASSFLLPRLLGLQRAKEIMFFGEKLTAQQMFEWGIVNKVVPHGELMSYANMATLKLIPPKGAWNAVRMTKEVIHKPLIEAVTKALDMENAALNKAFASNDFLEAVTSRMEKREPVFTGK